MKTQVRDGRDENGRRGVSDEFRGRMLRGGRGESGGGSRCSALVSWGDGVKCDDRTQTRTRLIFIMRVQQLFEYQ